MTSNDDNDSISIENNNNIDINNIENIEKSLDSFSFSEIIKQYRFVLFIIFIGFLIIIIYFTSFIIININLKYSINDNNGEIQENRENTLSSNPSPSLSPSITSSRYKSSLDNFILLSDIHMDPLYSPYASMSDFCRFDKGDYLDDEYMSHTCVDDDSLEHEEGKNYLFGTYGCDSPVNLVYSMFQQMTTIPQQPSFIIILGDVASHCLYSVDHLVNVTDAAFRIIRSYYKDIPIIPTLGNNDVYPHNTLSVGSSQVISNISNVWRTHNLIPEESINEFEKAGYYSYSPNNNLRILSLNTLYYYISWCDNNSTLCDNGYNINYKQDPAGQFRWIEDQLRECLSINQSVYFIGHVGPQCSRSTKKQLWIKQYSDRFINILDTYSDIIKGLFFSHIHRDSMTLIMKDENSNIYTPSNAYDIINTNSIYNQQTIIIPSAVSPNTFQNPCYRNIFYNKNTLYPIDYYQYYTDLKDVQNYNTSYPIWKLEYIFRNTFNVQDMLPSSMLNLFINFQRNETLFNIWKKYHISESLDTTDYNSINNSTLLCTLSGFCNYLEECISNSGGL